MTQPQRDDWKPDVRDSGQAGHTPTPPENRRIYHPVAIRFPGDRPRLEAKLAATDRALVACPDELAALEEKGCLLLALGRDSEAAVIYTGRRHRQ